MARVLSSHNLVLQVGLPCGPCPGEGAADLAHSMEGASNQPAAGGMGCGSGGEVSFLLRGADDSTGVTEVHLDADGSTPVPPVRPRWRPPSARAEAGAGDGGMTGAENRKRLRSSGVSAARSCGAGTAAPSMSGVAASASVSPFFSVAPTSAAAPSVLTRPLGITPTPASPAASTSAYFSRPTSSPASALAAAAASRDAVADAALGASSRAPMRMGPSDRLLLAAVPTLSLPVAPPSLPLSQPRPPQMQRRRFGDEDD